LTVGYCLRKFAPKHRGPVIAGAVVFLTLLAGIAGTTFGLLRAEERRNEADQAKEREAETAYAKPAKNRLKPRHQRRHGARRASDPAEEQMDEPHRALADLRDVGLQVARTLLHGRADFWPFAIGSGPDGRVFILVSRSADTQMVAAAAGPEMSVRVIDPLPDNDAEYDAAEGHVLAELRRLMAAGAVRGWAVVSDGLYCPPDGSDPVPAVNVAGEGAGAGPTCWVMPHDPERAVFEAGG
jgi:hypothetical protein